MNQYHWYVVAILVCLCVNDIRTEAESKDLENRGASGELKHNKADGKNNTTPTPIGSSQLGATGCQAGFTLVGSICYFFSSPATTWDQALDDCRARGTHLAYPLNSEENTALKNYIRNTYGGSPEAWWIGGADVAKEGDWLWSHTSKVIDFTDWCAVTTEPNNYGVENCLSFNSLCDFHWNDRACNYNQFGHICQP